MSEGCTNERGGVRVEKVWAGALPSGSPCRGGGLHWSGGLRKGRVSIGREPGMGGEGGAHPQPLDVRGRQVAAVVRHVHRACAAQRPVRLAQPHRLPCMRCCSTLCTPGDPSKQTVLAPVTWHQLDPCQGRTLHVDRQYFQAVRVRVHQRKHRDFELCLQLPQE